MLKYNYLKMSVDLMWFDDLQWFGSDFWDLGGRIWTLTPAIPIFHENLSRFWQFYTQIDSDLDCAS